MCPKNSDESKDPQPVPPPPPFVGQEEITKKIDQLINRSKASQSPFPHTLFIGEEGMGKRTLALNIAHNLGTKVTQMFASAVGRAGDLIGILTNLDQGDILLIEDFHQMNKIVKEFLYPAVDNLTIDFVIDKGPYAKNIKFHLKGFTLIATVLDGNLLEKRVRDLFTCTYKFAPYPKVALQQILAQECHRLTVSCDPNALDMLAEVAEGNSGKGVRLIRTMVKHLHPSQPSVLTTSIVQEYLHLTTYNVQPVVESIDIERRILDEVKREVWRRDKGKCTRCGSRERLEYDHIIPLSKGGSSTTRNIELLCEVCNRSKSDSI